MNQNLPKTMPAYLTRHLRMLHERNDKLQAKVDELVGQASKHEAEKMAMREQIEAATKRVSALIGPT